MNDDLALLRQFAEENSESAFAEIVSRYVNLVYSVALRQIGDAHLAEEVTQVVFIILARKAKSLDDKTILSGWLCRTARYASANALTVQRRRQHREQEAYMQNMLDENASEAELQTMWNQIAPLLDGALEKLGRKDHDALALRFFENKSFAEVGAALEVSESAAKMRVNRALEKLRKIFRKHGVSSTTAALAGSISAHSIQVAPVALAKSATALAVTKGAAASGSTLTLIHGALKIMAWTKMKMTVVISAGVLLAVGGGTVLYAVNQHSHHEGGSGGLNDPVEIKVNWMMGKKYSMTMDLNQSSETQVPGRAEPVSTVTKIKQDWEITPIQKQPDGSWELGWKFTDVSLEISQGGATLVSYDSSQNQAANADNPGALMGLIVGVPLQYYIDGNGEVQKVDGTEDLMRRVEAGKPQAQMLFQQLFGEATLKQYGSMSGFQPDHPVKLGESWWVKKDIPSAVGTLALNSKMTFSNWEQHNDRKCAHLKMEGQITTKTMSTASGAAIEIQKGEIQGDVWFDPALGMFVESDSDQKIALKVMTQAQTLTPQMNQRVHWALADVE